LDQLHNRQAARWVEERNPTLALKGGEAKHEGLDYGHVAPCPYCSDQPPYIPLLWGSGGFRADNKKDVPYQSLLKIFLAETLEKEFKI
jgi:hypothetical protein